MGTAAYATAHRRWRVHISSARGNSGSGAALCWLAKKLGCQPQAWQTTESSGGSRGRGWRVGFLRRLDRAAVAAASSSASRCTTSRGWRGSKVKVGRFKPTRTRASSAPFNQTEPRVQRQRIWKVSKQPERYTAQHTHSAALPGMFSIGHPTRSPCLDRWVQAPIRTFVHTATACCARQRMRPRRHTKVSSAHSEPIFRSARPLHTHWACCAWRLSSFGLTARTARQGPMAAQQHHVATPTMQPASARRRVSAQQLRWILLSAEPNKRHGTVPHSHHLYTALPSQRANTSSPINHIHSTFIRSARLQLSCCAKSASDCRVRPSCLRRLPPRPTLRHVRFCPLPPARGPGCALSRRRPSPSHPPPLPRTLPCSSRPTRATPCPSLLRCTTLCLPSPRLPCRPTCSLFRRHRLAQLPLR